MAKKLLGRNVPGIVQLYICISYGNFDILKAIILTHGSAVTPTIFYGNFMANIKLKNINNLETWEPKELRKLRMVTKNRISYFEDPKIEKKLASNHPLYGMEITECKALLKKIISTENKNSKELK